MKSRIPNISLTLYCLLLFAILIAPKTTKAQEWSEPITIFQGTSTSRDVDITIDNNNHIHVVWEYKVGDNFWKILYSKSTDQGETWSEPYDIVKNPALWMCNPKIVTGPDNKLYVTYDYNTNSQVAALIHMQIFDGETWSEPVLVSENVGIFIHSNLIMDKSGILHIFWHNFQERRLRYRTYSNGSFSPISNPYPNNNSVTICCIQLSEQNNIHMTAYETTQSTTYMTYLKKVDNDWTNPDSVCKPFWASMSMAIGKSNEPHIVWVSRTNYIDTTYYTTQINDQWQTSILTPKYSTEHSMIIEKNGTVHIVQSEKTETGHNQMHYVLKNGTWTSQIIEFEEKGFNDHKLIAKDTSLYLIFLHYPLLYYKESRVLIRKLKIENQNSIEQTAKLNDFHLRVFPNPSTISQGIKIETKSTSAVQVQIYNISGFLVFKTTVHPSQNTIEWNKETSNYKKVPPGIYLVKAVSDKQMKTETIVITE